MNEADALLANARERAKRSHLLSSLARESKRAPRIKVIEEEDPRMHLYVSPSIAARLCELDLAEGKPPKRWLIWRGGA